MVNGNSYKSLGADQTLTYKPWTPEYSNHEQICGPEVISIKPGKTYRFRSIAATALSAFVYAIEDHKELDIIAVDSINTKPARTDIVHMGSGQRYDFLMKSKTEQELAKLGKTEFWLQIETRYRQQNNTFYALLSYESHSPYNRSIPHDPPTTKPIQIPYKVQNWMEYTFEPFEDNGMPLASEVTRQVFLHADQITQLGKLHWTANNHSWTDADQGDVVSGTGQTDTPYLVQIYEKGEKAIPNYHDAITKYGGWDPKLNVYIAKAGEIIDIILVNEPNGIAGGFDTHPWHIHGGPVWDLGSGQGSYDASRNEQKLKGYNPIRRDTSFLYKYVEGDDVNAGLAYTSQGWRAWRLKIENPG